MKSVSIRERQLGTATYIIDFLAIRAGNEKSDEEADTVGCCSLRKQHVTLLEENRIYLNFLGKDSVKYEKTIQMLPLAYENIKMFISDKKNEDDIFDEINSSKLNEYLQSLMTGLTAKVFRTFNASNTLQKELDKCSKTSKDILEDKLGFYNYANKQVALLCNHQKGVNKKTKESMKNMEKKIQDMKMELDEKKKKKDKKKVIERLSKKISKTERILENKIENQNVALNTSKINYNDPRISVAFCKKNEIPIEKIFTKVLLEKFIWSMKVSSSWKF